MTYKCLNQPVLSYLRDTVTLYMYMPGRSLRSAAHDLCRPVQAKKKIGECALSIAGPKVWDRLPHSVRAIDSITHFKSVLKTHLFRKYLT